MAVMAAQPAGERISAVARSLVGQCTLQPLVGERLERLEVSGDGMQARPEGRAARRLRHGGDDARPAGRAVHPQALGDLRRRNGTSPSILRPDLLEKLKARLLE